MADIQDVLIQNEIASSLLSPAEQAQEQAGPEQTESEYSVGGDDLLNEFIRESQPGRFELGDAWDAERQEAEALEGQNAQTLKRFETLSPAEQTQEAQSQEQPDQTLAPSIEAIQQHIETLDSAISEHGLTDAPAMKGFADELASAMGTNAVNGGWDVAALGTTTTRLGIEALRLGEAVQWDISKLQTMPPDAAEIMGYEILRGIGLDPQAVNADRQELANTFLAGAVNFFAAVAKYGGKVSDVGVLNKADANMYFVGRIAKALGHDGPVSQKAANAAANAFGKYLLQLNGRIFSANQRQAEARPGQGSRSNAGRGRGQRVPQRFKEGLKGTRAPRMESNQDIFSPQVLQGALTQRL